MAVISKTVTIRAAPEEVFDLVTRVERFREYSDMIRGVDALGGGRYHWSVRFSGVALDWDAEVTESVRPRRFAWRSVGGTENRGSFTLTPVPDGTQVEFFLEYRVESPVIRVLLERLARPLIERAAGELLASVKERLERGPPLRHS